jgi:hypothetical protein
MARIFKINGITINRITKGDWRDEPANLGLDGMLPRLRWVRHIWSAEVVAASDYNSLYALEGQQMSLTTVNYSDRNSANYQTYYTAICERVEGQHQGNLFNGVTAEFLVRL